MKGKLSFMWRATLALVLVLSLGLVMAVPVAASPDVSDVWVQLDDYSDGGIDVTYSVYFTPGADLAEDVDSITVFFPAETTVPQGSVTARLDLDGDAVTEVAVDATASGAGYRVTVTTPEDITAGSEVRVEIDGVTNPSPGSATAYTLEVYTSQETTKVESSSYTIPATSVGNVSFAPTTGTAGAADSYTIDFDEGTQGELDVWDTVTVVFPTGTVIPSSIASSKVTVQSDDSDMDAAEIPLDVAPVVDGRFVTLTVPEIGWHVSDGTGELSTDIQIVFLETAGITNPTVADDTDNVQDGDYIGKVYTSDDLAIEDGSRYDIDADSVSQVVFDAVNSDAEVMVSTATVDRAAELIIQTKDQYGNLKDVPVSVVFDLSSSSTTTGSFSLTDWGTEITEVTISSTGHEKTFYYKDTTAGTATITAENAAHGWSDTWDVEVTAETVVELWDGDTLVGEYTTITLAIADALAGNVIKAGPGTYVEDISVGTADLTLESTAGVATTTIEGSMTLDDGADDFVLGGASGKGFTLKKGVESLIALDGPTDVTISYNTLEATTTRLTGATQIDAIRMWHSAISGLAVTNNTFSIDSLFDMGVRGHTSADVSGLTVADNTFTGVGSTLDHAAIQIDKLDMSDATKDTVISGNEITGVKYGVAIGAQGGDLHGGDANATFEISGNTFDGCDYGIWLIAVPAANTDQDVVITENTFTNNTKGLAISDDGDWAPEDFTVKYNDFSGNTEYGVYNDNTAVDATHNYWGDDTGPSEEGTGMGDAISADVTYDPWLVTTVSAGEWATGETSLDARAAVGVKVSGAAGTTQKIGVARYTENPMATPEFTPLTGGFFDVYVEGAEDATEIGIKFYADGMTTQSKVYVWDFFEEVWTECSDQLYNATYGYIWVKVRTAAADVPTVPLVSDLAGTPFAISTEEAPPVTLESIAALPSSVSLDDVGDTQQLTVTATYDDASTAVVTATSTYVSVPETVATVSTGGLITAVAEGSATITVSYTEGGVTETDTVSVTVSGVFDPMVYDEDEDGAISKTEALTGVTGYFDGEITKDQALEVIALYFAS